MSETTLTRRSFVKAAALTGAAAAIGASMSGSLVETDAAWADEPVESKVLKTSCHGCIQMCPARAYVENGVVTKLEGDPDAPVSRGSLCLKGLNQLHTMYSPRRIIHPIKRAGERGENKWEVISWDEAIELASDQIVSAIEKYGPYSFFASVGGGGSYSFMEAMTLPMAFGSPTVFEPGCAQCYLPRYSMSKYMYGGNDQSVADNAVQEIFRTGENNHADNGHHLGRPALRQRDCRVRPRHGRAASYRREDGRHRPEFQPGRAEGRRVAAGPSRH